MRFHHWGIVTRDLQKAIRACRRFLRFRSNAEAELPAAAVELREPRDSRVKLTLIENACYPDAGSHEPLTDINAVLNRARTSGCMTATDYIWSVGTLV